MRGAVRLTAVTVLGLSCALVPACSGGPASLGPLRCPGTTSHFELDLVADSRGAATPLAAAETTARRGAPGFRLPTNGWVVVSQDAQSASVRSGDYQVHVVGALQHTWLVDSGFRCGG